MPWVRLLKSYVSPANGKKLEIGRVFKVDTWKMDELITRGIAERYTGTLPPTKMKTDFFKPKT
jgi:hypothetical protein